MRAPNKYAIYDKKGNFQDPDSYSRNRGQAYYKEARRLESVRQKSLKSTRIIKGFKEGGKVKKTGIYKLHKGEVVLSKSQKKSVASALKNIHR